MDKKEITLVSVIDKDGINPLLTKAFTNIRKAEEYFRDLVGNDDKENDIDFFLENGYYTNGHEYGKTISISEIELYDDN